MPVVPVYGDPKVSPRALGTPYLRSEVTEEDFGAGVAEGIAGLGTAVGKIALDMRDRSEAVVLSDAMMKTSTIENEMEFGESGFLNKKLADAVGIGQRAPQDFKQRVEKEVLPSLGSTRLKQAFRKTFDPIYSRYGLAAMRHEAQEHKALDGTTYKAGVSRERDNAASYFTDPQAVRTSVNRIRGITESYYARNGVRDPEVMKSFVEAEVSLTHEAVIDRFLKSGSGLQAMEYYRANEAEIRGTDRAKVQASIQPIADDQVAQDASDKAWNESGGRLDVALEAAREIKEARIRQSTERLLVLRNNQRDAARAEARQATMLEAWGPFSANYRTSEIPAGLKATLGPDLEKFRDLEWQQQQRSKQKAEETGIPTRYEMDQAAAWYRITKEAVADPRGFIDPSRDVIAQDGMALGKRYLNSAIALQDEMRKADAAGKTIKSLSILTPSQMLNETAEAAGIIPEGKSEATWTSDQNERYRILRDNLQVALDGFHAEHGRDAVPKEIKEMLAGLVTEVKLRRTAWFDRSLPIGAAKPEEVLRAYVDYESILEREIAGARRRGDADPEAAGERVLGSIRNILAAERKAQPEQVEQEEIEDAYFRAQSNLDEALPPGIGPAIRRLSVARTEPQASPSSVPEPDRRLIIDGFKKNFGREPTEDQIRAYYFRQSRATGAGP